MKTRQEMVKEIRAELKAMGINSRQVSITSKASTYDDVINAKIKDLTVSMSAIEDVLNKYSSIDRDEMTGEILNGGNTYTNVIFDSEALENAKSEMLELAQNIIDTYKDNREGTGELIYKDDTKKVFYLRPSSHDSMGRIVLKGLTTYEDGSQYFDKDIKRYAAYNANVIAEALVIFKYQHNAKIGEVVEPTADAPAATETVDIVEVVEEITQQEEQPAEPKTSESVKVVYNEDKQGIEVYFPCKPDDAVRANLKANGFRWSRNNGGFWYAKDTQNRRDFVTSYLTQENENNTTETTTEPQAEVYPEIEVNDIETYTVSQELSDRENAGHWVFRSDKRDHQAEIQNTLQAMNNDVLELLEGVTDTKVIYNAKRWLQSYKKRYYEWYMKKLRQDANNPSWTTTGRDGRNRNKDAKYQSAYDKLMRHYIDELKPEYESKLWSIKKQVNKIKQQAEAVELQKAIEEAKPIELIRTKGLVNYHARSNENIFIGGTVSATIYNYQEYSIVKTWGSWRLYKNGIELSGERYATLDTAKKVLSVEVAKVA